MKPILDRDEPEILAIYDKILTETKKRGQYAGIHCGSAAYAAKAINMGFRLVSLSSDSGILAVAARGMVGETRAGVKI
jgi:4-hydroxy-2-oxoheptanedioate aldolase